MNGGFKDHFSGHAGTYAQFRPGYPEHLFDWLAAQAPLRDLAWDCACGNGQAAVALATRFTHIYASDASVEQIGQSRPITNVDYRVERAEDCSLPSASVDLITVAQAYHWLDHEAFVPVSERVLKAAGVLAIWTYGLAKVTPEIDVRVKSFYGGTVGSYWPAERRLVENGYLDLNFPWDELTSPQFSIELDWSLRQFAEYLRTWSAVRRCIAATGADPVDPLLPELEREWGPAGHKRTVRWPVTLRCFRKPL